MTKLKQLEDKLNWLIYEMDQMKMEQAEEQLPKKNMTFGQALIWLKRGSKVGRWKRHDIYLYHQKREAARGAEIRVRSIDGYFYPWTANHQELLAEDWRVIEDAS